MTTSRGRAGYGLVVSLCALVASVACGGSGDDDDATAGSAGTSGTKSNGGTSGTDASGGAPDGSGGDGATTARGGTSSSGGSSGKGGTASAQGGSSGKAGTSSTQGGTASAQGGSSGTANPDTEGLLDAIGDACERDCDAQFALECAPPNSNTLTCQLSCAASTAQLGDFCLAEYRDYVVCRGDGGYDCVNTTAYPRATCAKEQLAFSECTQHIGCKRYCRKVLDLGCSEQPFDDCLEACLGEDASLPADCNYRNETIAYCQATSSTECAGERLNTPAVCASSVLSVAECISDESSELCDGWCWAAEHLGCGGGDCAEDCKAKKAPAMCGQEWDSLLDCVLFFDEAACDGDQLVGNSICDSEQQAYDTCMQGDAGAN